VNLMNGGPITGDTQPGRHRGSGRQVVALVSFGCIGEGRPVDTGGPVHPCTKVGMSRTSSSPSSNPE